MTGETARSATHIETETAPGSSRFAFCKMKQNILIKKTLIAALLTTDVRLDI